MVSPEQKEPLGGCGLVLVDGPQAIRANVHLLLAALINHCPFGDIRHKTPTNRMLRVAHVVPVQWTFAANIASLCHSEPLPHKNSLCKHNNSNNTTISGFAQVNA